MENTNNTTLPQKQAPKGFVIGFTITVFAVLIYIIYAIFSAEPGLPSENNAYIITTNFIKSESGQTYAEIDCPFSDYQHDYLNDSSYLIVSHFTYKNDFGVEKRFNYKARVKWNGGKWENKDNWTLIYLEEYNPVSK